MSNPWVLLGLVVSVAMVAGTPFIWRRRGAAFGVRWFAAALLPAGFALTGILTLVGRVSSAVTGFFGRAVFSPAVWTGYALLGAALVIWLVARFVSSRSTGSSAGSERAAVGSTPAVARRGSAAAVGSGRTAAPAGDDDFADIEAILKRRGI